MFPDPPSTEAIIYIDGFNFYRRVLEKSSYKWLDVYQMCLKLLPDLNITKVNYFTARLKPTPIDASRHIRQEIYLRALAINPKVQIHFGKFIHEVKKLPSYPWSFGLNGHPNFSKVLTSKEKGSDVSLASHLVFDALKGAAKYFIVLTTDSDQVAPLKLLRDESDSILGLLLPDKPGAKELLQLNLPIVRKIRPSLLASCQMPNQLEDNNGLFHKPIGW